jgi:hypothetical protein
MIWHLAKLTCHLAEIIWHLAVISHVSRAQSRDQCLAQ